MSDLHAAFHNPGNSYRPQPFWFLNHQLEETRLREQIREMAAQGVGGAVLHARHGLLTEYMSPQWLQAIRVCLEELQAHGMEAWLYDENNWPSGTHGGALTQGHPEYRMRYLRVQTFSVSGGATFQATLDPDDNELLCVQAARFADRQAGRLEPDVRDLTDRYQTGKLRWEAPPGDWLVAVYWICPVAAPVTFANGYYLDTMNEEAVQAFRELAYEPYAELVAAFPDTVKGVFTDEPGLMVHDAYVKTEAVRSTVADPQRVLPGLTLPWTRDFESKFWELVGYDIRPRLLSLTHDLGPETVRLRADYYRAVSTWYVTSYHQQLAGWCHERGIEYIGHTLEDPLFKQVRTQGDQSRVLGTMDRPGLDYLGHGVGTPDNPHRILAGKCAASVAHTLGRARVMCEAFGASGQGHTLPARRLDANFMACLGVNMIIPHAFYYSLEGYRKNDAPPTEFYHQPYWPMYRHFADYLARLCLIQSTGHHVAQVAVVTPVQTVYQDMVENGQAVTEPPCQTLLANLSESLLALHFDYDYLDAAQLEEATLSEGLLGLESTAETWPLVILCGTRVLSLDALRKLREFFHQGGKIIALGELPAETAGSGSVERLQELVAEIFGEPDSQGHCRNEHASGGIALAMAGEALDEWLATNLPRLIEPEVILTDERGQPQRRVICCHRRTGELETYLLVNRTTDACSCRLSCQTSGELEEWSLEEGERAPMAATNGADGRLQVALEFDPAEARLLVVNTTAAETALVADSPEPVVLERLELSSQWQFDCQGRNVAILDTWSFVARDQQAGWAERAPSMVNSYRTTFKVTGTLGPVRLVLDDIEQWLPAHSGFLSGLRSLEILVNGQHLPALQPSEWQDPDYLWGDISGLLIQGENTVEIRTIAIYSPMHGLREPVYLVGAFRLVEGVLRPEVGEITGLFTGQGYPHLAQAGLYRQTFTVPERFTGGQRLILDPGEVHGCLRVSVNGQEVGCRLWAPYEVDLTPAVRPGKNELTLEVAGTLGNLYDKHVTPCGIEGEAVIWVLS
jgi:hypothetical protein